MMVATLLIAGALVASPPLLDDPPQRCYYQGDWYDTWHYADTAPVGAAGTTELDLDPCLPGPVPVAVSDPPTPPALPATGLAEIAHQAATGALLVGLGVALTIPNRRRRTPS